MQIFLADFKKMYYLCSVKFDFYESSRAFGRIAAGDA